ncbi:hypothetical protein HF086_006407 [Spodoptera exigua]|uniref:Zinc finger PHD-type domain-containing protein n=1 Tax=Spodoptera exigua TaxID=7107 RepID=A0A922MX16_SPOEX|nr:hypothetical protein HF086_006407 [Spodoptera exigua]
MPGIQCAGCNRFASAIEGVKCANSKCRRLYHRGCVGFKPDVAIPASWRCPECKKNLVRDNRAETPVRGPASAAGDPTTQTCLVALAPNELNASCSGPAPVVEQQCTSPSSASTPLRRGAFSAATAAREISPITGPDMGMLMDELRAMRAEIQEFRKEMELEMAQLVSSVTSCNVRIDGLEARIITLEQRASVGRSSADEVVEELRRELNDRDQDLLANDVEITCVPEAPSENPIHIAKAVGLKLGVQLEERDIVSAERVGGKQLNATSSAGPAATRPRAIAVRLARRDLRDQLLAGARVRRGATTADLGTPGPPQRFFVNERLTRTNRRLFRMARDAARLHNWRFVWTKRGRILSRRSPGDPTQRISTDEDIERVFGPVNKETI